MILGKTKYGLSTHGAYNNVRQLLPLLYRQDGRVYKNHVFVASPEMCEYIRNYASDHYPEFENALIWPHEWKFNSQKRTFIIGDDSLARTALRQYQLDTVLVTDWPTYPMCSRLELSNQFYPHEGRLPYFARTFQAYHRVKRSTDSQVFEKEN